MGLAVLPGRLKEELGVLGSLMVEENPLALIKENEKVVKHLDWCEKILAKYSDITKENVDEILRKEVGILSLIHI